MAVFSIAITLLALSPLAPSVLEDTLAQKATLRLVWYDGERLLPRRLDSLTQEVDSLFAPLGVELEWTRGVGKLMTPGDAASRDLELKVLLLPTEPANWGLDPNCMGVVLGGGTSGSTPGAPPPGGAWLRAPREVVYLFYNPIVRTLGFRVKSEQLRQPKEATYVVRALARVLAHEMVHAMAPDHPHHEDGLMSCKLTKTALVKRDLRIDSDAALAFKMELARYTVARRASWPGGRGFLAPWKP